MDNQALIESLLEERSSRSIPLNPPAEMLGYGEMIGLCAISASPHFLARFFRYPEGSGILFPKHAFTRYCGLTIDSLVTRDHGPSAEGPASFNATRWKLCDALVTSEGRLRP